jgi:hypothetical protein
MARRRIVCACKYLYALMEDQTRFWIAQQVADTKYTSNVRRLFALAKEITQKLPNTLITDRARPISMMHSKKNFLQ